MELTKLELTKGELATLHYALYILKNDQDAIKFGYIDRLMMKIFPEE